MIRQLQILQNITKIWQKSLVITVMCLVFPISSYALGLGGLKLKSALNQKLDASIQLLNISDQEFSELTIQLASPAVYERMGIELSPQLEKLRFTVTEAGGDSIIHVTTPLSVTEPYLNFLIEVNWASGRLIREFTVLLDPPVFLDEEGGASISAPEADLPPVLTTPLGATEAVVGGLVDSVASVAADTAIDRAIEDILSGGEIITTTATTITASQVEAVAVSPSSLVYNKVQRNEVLWNIANEMRPENISVEQMMLALQRENPQAFFGDNVSMLKAGAVLRIEDTSTLSDVSSSQALLDIAVQNKEWLSYRKARQAKNAVAADSAHLTPMDGEKNGIGETNGSVAIPSALVANQPLLKLVAPTDEKLSSDGDTNNAALEAAEGQVTDLNFELVMATEEVEVKKRENENLVSRLSSLEEQVTAMQSIVQLKDAELAKLRTDDAAIVDEDALLTPIEVGIPTEAEAGASVTKVITQEVAERAKKLWQDPLTLATGIAGILLIALIGILLKRKSARNAKISVPLTSTAQDGVDANALSKGGNKGGNSKLSEALFPEDSNNAQFGNNKGQPVLNAPFELDDELADLGPMTDMALDDTLFAGPDDGLLDAMSEADMYIMYEKYDKAETLLQDAIQSAPDRHELKLKLLEVYAESGDHESFNTQADEFYAAINGDESHPLWLNALHFAGVIGSDNPLFSGKLAEQEKLSLDSTLAADEFELLSISVNDGLNGATGSSAVETTQQTEWLPDQVTEFVADDETQLFNAETNTKKIDNKLTDAFDSSLLDAVDSVAMRESIIEDTTLIAEHDFSSEFEILAEEQTDELNRFSKKADLSDDDLQNAMSSFTEEALVAVDATPESGVTVENVFGNDALAKVEKIPKSETDLVLEDADASEQAKNGSNTVDDEFGDTSFFLLSDEVGTKLDLARAYIEMGDSDGASDLLNEVLSEGNQRQKLEAKSLMEMTTV